LGFTFSLPTYREGLRSLLENELVIARSEATRQSI
ncbi:MAG: hypothetical protein JWO64_1006, partial [Hyphomicrobiales bacterium]|nr:hypothetical protein [Hyphomicrobiales bacterium]